MKTLEKKYTSVLKNIIDDKIKTFNQPILVFVGILPYINLDEFKSYIADTETFNKEGNSTLYNNDWFVKIFSKLNETKSFHILSHQQYAYITEYLSPDFFKNRIIIIYDNLRSLFLINKADYLEKTSDKGLEERPEELPVYQAEQFKIGHDYFYSLRKFDDSLIHLPLFTDLKEIQDSPDDVKSVITIDVTSNPYAIDLLVNAFLKGEKIDNNITVKISSKNILTEPKEEILKKVNYVLSFWDRCIYKQKAESVNKTYIPSHSSLSLLKKYWGENASFRDILFYENPEINNSKIPISQGVIVDTIIHEYQNGRKGIIPRDIFITAPTGAGKSLIFQIPAFYAAENKDVTIVVSPLKALMTDQVENLHRERNYDRVEFINSDLNLIDRDTIISRCKNGEIDILYLSPELLLSYDITYFIGNRKLGLIIVDEAHLITTWGRDFRVDYWFLGNHINKIRKYSNYLFPLVALTATAVYGGINDMVFDSISSLNMHDPHKFIGNVKREDIEFVINTHDDYKEGRYDSNKEKETLSFIKGVYKLGLKTIIYAPYTRHIKNLKSKADEEKPNMVVAYHGGMGQDEQKLSYNNFKNNQQKIMIATKAFGMGVDIPDIQVVYHHAPSGLLPDYIQEIGRAARKKNLKGYASLTFSPSDLRYSKQLFGMSSLKTFQLKAVLQRIIHYYENNGKKRNMLMAANDFAYIFNSVDDIDQKISTALMMIEKDYLIKSRFNVLIARPKRIFAKVYARTNLVGLQKLKSKFGECFNEIPLHYRGDYHWIELNLDKIWSTHFSDRSFPQIKNDFYNYRFLNEDGIELTPQVKITHTLESTVKDTLISLRKVVEAIKKVFANLKREGTFFSEMDFNNGLEEILKNHYNTEKITSFILSTYSSSQHANFYALEGDAFLQRRKKGNSVQYQILNSNYEAKCMQLLTLFSNLFDNDLIQQTSRFVSTGDTPIKNHIRLGSLLEILGIGSFETQGGDDPKLFIRINDPNMIKRDSSSKNYTNFILESVKRRHKVSCQIFEHFFTHYFNNKTRWNFIEDFFLGHSYDELIEKYEGAIRNDENIIEYLKKNAKYRSSDLSTKGVLNDSIHKFDIRENEFYYADNLLTIDKKTFSIRRWVSEDPVLLHRNIVEHKINIDKECYKILMSKIQSLHYSYYRDFMGLHLLIDFPGYEKKVMAKVPYTDKPIQFYKWWKKNEDVITLNYTQQINLFLIVNNLNPNVLIKKHRLKIEK